MDTTRRKFKVKIIKVVSPVIFPKINGQERPFSRKIGESDESTEMSSGIFKQTQTVKVFSKKKVDTSSIENDRYAVSQNDENIFISNSVDQIFPQLTRDRSDSIPKEETEIENKIIKKKKKKKKIKLQDLLQQNPNIPDLELAPISHSAKKINLSQSPSKNKNKFGIRKIQLLDRPSSRKEQLAPIMAPEVAIRKYANKIKIIQHNSGKLKPFILLVDLECLGILDEAFFGFESQEEYLDEQVKIAFSKHYQEIECLETGNKFYVYTELKEKIIYMKKLFSVILVLQRKEKIFEKVLQIIGGWFDTIVEIQRIVIRDRQATMVDYSSIFDNIMHEGQIRRVVLFQNTDYTHLPMPQYPNNAALLKAVRSTITADQYIVMVQKLKEATLNELDLLEQQIPWFSLPAYQVRVVLLQKKFYFSTMRNMMKNINNPNFNSFFGFTRIEHAIVAQMNDVQFHAFLSKNTCYKINFDKALTKLKEERQKKYIIENDLNYKKKNLNYNIAIQKYDQINTTIADIKVQFLKDVNTEKQQLAEDLFDRNEDNLDFQIERCKQLKKLMKKSEDLENDSINQISFYDIEYSQELQNYFLYITNDFT